MKHLITLFSLLSLFICSSLFAQLTVKDQESTPNTLLQINDEGIAGSITLPELTSIGTYSSKLYNLGGKLYWSSKQLGFAGSAGGWTDDGSVVRLSNATDRVGIGTINPLSSLSVGGDGVTNATIYGETSGFIGIRGNATSSGLVANYGGYFDANGHYGRGVYGKATGELGKGVQGYVTGNSGYGVYGFADNSGDVTNYGGYFEANGTYGRGVYGYVTGHDALGVYGYAIGNYGTGVYAKADGTDGFGVFGYATGSSGIAIKGSALNTGYAGYFNGRGYFSENVGIGKEDPEDKLIIKMDGLTWAEPHFALEASGSTNKWDFTVGSSDIFFIGYNESSKMVINTDGDVGIGTTSPSRKLYVNGDAGGAGPWNNDSDRRLKKNIKTIPNALEKVTKLRGVNFKWIDHKNHSEGLKMGFIAQEAKEVIPEVVSKNGEYFSMQYAPITALLVEAVKEQNKEFRTQNVELKKRVEQLEEIVAELAKVRNKTILNALK